MNSPAVKIENLDKRFGSFYALKDLNLEVAEGEIFGLLGPNGAGKTTTIKLMTGLLRPSRGRISIKGLDLASRPRDCKKKFALIPDVPYVYEKLTGWEFMKFTARIYDMDGAGTDSRISEQLMKFNINEVAHDLVDSYSHGLRQRLLMASVMMRDPDIIILDEPMVGLDPEAARMVKNLFMELARENKTIFLSTHTLSDAQEMCSRIGIISRGELIACGSMAELEKAAAAVKGDLVQENSHSGSLEDIYLRITRNI